MREVLSTLAAAAVLAPGAATAREYDARACASSRPAPVAPEAKAARAAVARALAEDHGSGIQVAVMRDGKLVWSEAMGRAGFWPSQPLTTETRMRIGSVSKVFTAVAAARLAESGRMDLDAPVQRYVPEFPVKPWPVTIRQLATHTSGIRQYDFSSLKDSNSTKHYARLSDALATFASDPLVSRPGTTFHYSSLAFNLLGVAVERAGAEPYPQAVERLTTEPLGMTHSEIDDGAATMACRSQFSTILGGWLRIPAPPRDASDYYPSGGMLSTAEDLAQMADGVMRGGAVSTATLALFTTPARLSNGRVSGYGFGWEVGRDASDGVTWYGHGGTTNGAYASVRYYPRERVTVAAIANYNFWLTKRRPSFFRAAREELPRAFGVAKP